MWLKLPILEEVQMRFALRKNQTGGFFDPAPIQIFISMLALILAWSVKAGLL
jgi:hypothetical protein